MKKCPSCGYENTPTERQLLRQYKKAFGTLPVRAMINRSWICRGELLSVEEVRAELVRFFGLKGAEALDEFLANPAMPCSGVVCDLSDVCAPSARA
jgi:hypothetical protein